VGIHHDLASTIAAQLHQLREKSAIEDRRIAAMVTEERDDDPSGQEGSHQCLDGLSRQVRLIGNTDQGAVDGFRQRAQPNRDRAADAVLRMGVLDMVKASPASASPNAGSVDTTAITG